MATNLLFVYYSAYGHIFDMVQAAAAEARKLPDIEVKVAKVAEFEAAKTYLSSQPPYVQAQELQKSVPDVTAEDLLWSDGIVWGVPTRFGVMPAQMKQFLDSSGGVWARGELEGKATGVIVSSGSIHGGQETTAVTMMIPLMHFGMIYVGLPYGENPEQQTAEGIGGSPYAASVVAGPDGSKQAVEQEKTMAGRLAVRVARVAQALKGTEVRNK